MNLTDLINDAKLAIDTIENAKSEVFRKAAAEWLESTARQIRETLAGEVEDMLVSAPDLPRLIPEVGKSYVTRHHVEVRDFVMDTGDLMGTSQYGTMYYRDGVALGVWNPDWDLVKEIEPAEKAPAKNWPSLPAGIPAPPEGFAFVTEGELDVSPEFRTTDVLWFTGNNWSDNGGCGWRGICNGPWAVRIGSDIAKANGIV
jgi:hypothetical protein